MASKPHVTVSVIGLPEYNIRLSADAATALRTVLYSVGGSTAGPRRHLQAIFDGLGRAGVQVDGELCCDGQIHIEEN